MMSKFGDKWPLFEYVKIDAADWSIMEAVIEPFFRPQFEDEKFIGVRFFPKFGSSLGDVELNEAA